MITWQRELVLNRRPELPIELAKRLGKAFSIEPNMDRNSMQVANAKPRGVEVHQGRAESIPYPDHSFDAVVAMWVLHYVDDLDKSLEELVRVADPSAPNARIIIVQGAPDNEVVNMLNGVCAPLSRNPRIDHQGYILHKAADVFSRNGFADIAVHRVQAYCAFPEEEMDQRCEAAAEVLAKFWYIEDPSFGEMKQALIPELKLHFKDRPYTLTDEAAILVARATAN